MARKRFIVVHHSLTKDGATASWPAIEKYHREVHGWRDVGYHGGVEAVTSEPELKTYRYQAFVGRDDTDNASACPQADMNSLGVHVCFVGNFDEDEPSLKMLEVGARRLIIPWMREHGITPDRVIGHRDAGLMVGLDYRKPNASGPGGREFKTCPGLRFDLDALRRLVS